jgi:transketolase
MPRTDAQIANIARGGYVLKDCEGTPEAIIIATGSEVELAMQAADTLGGRKIRVVSMPSTDVFDAQDAAYRESVLPAACTARVAIEAAVGDGWYKYVGLKGKVIGINRFGESAPAGQLFKEFGFTKENLVKAVEDVL